MSLRTRVLKDTLQYSIANYFAMAVGIGVSLATKSILGAVGAGYWALFKVFQSYGEYSDLGTRDALLREIPQASGAGDPARCARLQNSALAFTAVMSVLSALVIAAIALFKTSDPVLRSGLLLVALLVIATHFYNFMLNLLRTLKKVGTLSVLIAVNIVLVAVFSVAGAMLGGVRGMTAGVLLSTVCAAGFAYRSAGINFRPEWNWTEIRRLIGIGLPVVVLSYVLITFLSIDAVMIGRMIGLEQLGYYTIALMTVQQVSSLGRFTQIIVFPHIQEQYGRTGSLESSEKYFVKTTQALQHFLPFIIGASVLLVPLIVHYLLPRFEPGIPAMKVLVTVYYFVAVSEMASTILFTVDRQKRLIPIYGVVVAVAALLNYGFIKAGYGIVGVAAATGISYLLFFLSVFIYSFRTLIGWRRAALQAGSILAMFAYFAACLYAVGRWVHGPNPVAETFFQLAVFVGAMLPLAIRYERKERILSAVAGILMNKIRTPK